MSAPPPAATAPSQRLTFPSDVALRKELLPHANHSAKMNAHLFVHLVEQYTEPGDSVLDPMAGAGTVLLAAVHGRIAHAIELEETNVAKIAANMRHLMLGAHARAEMFWSLGNAADWAGLTPLLHHSPDVIITSPPYGDLATRHRNREPNAKGSNVPEWRRKRKDASFHVDSYGTEFFQIGNMAYPLYLKAMAIVYRNCLLALRPGGRLIIVTADYWRDFAQVPLCLDTRHLCQAVGFTLSEWWARDRSRSLTSWQRMRLKAGLPVIDHEDVQVFTKPLGLEAGHARRRS